MAADLLAVASLLLVGLAAAVAATAPSLPSLFAEWKLRDSIRANLFDRQQATRAALLARRFVACLCSRRSGKTYGAASIMLEDAKQHPGSVYLYIAISGPSAAGIVWPIFKDLNRKLGLDCEFKEGDHIIIVPGGSTIHVLGADRSDLQERYYGWEIRGIVVDEAAVWRTDLESFYREILRPTLAKSRGWFLMLSMPGPVLAGYFFRVTQPEEHEREPEWMVCEWTVDDNPFMAEEWAEEFARLKRDDPLVESRAWFQRAWRGRWVPDTENNVYAFDPRRNRVAAQALRPAEQLIICLDTGRKTALTLGGYSPTSPVLTFYDSWKNADGVDCLVDEPKPGEAPGGLAPEDCSIVGRIRHWERIWAPLVKAVKGPPIRYIGDPANWQLLNELRLRHHIPIVGAEKTNKQDWILLMNSAFVTGQIQAVCPEGQPLAAEWVTLKRVPDGKGGWTEGPQENHDSDCALYTFRSSYQYTHKAVVKPVPGSPAAEQAEADRMEQAELKAWRQRQREARERAGGRRF